LYARALSLRRRILMTGSPSNQIESLKPTLLDDRVGHRRIVIGKYRAENRRRL
jgi:hypothetical protein